jgi:hypothetical protein
MAEGRSDRDYGIERYLATATVGSYEVHQAPSGKAGVHDNTAGVTSGSYAELRTAGIYRIEKATGFVALPGGRAYWDHSANAATYKKVNDRDFYLGRFIQDAASGDDECLIDLNADPRYDIDLALDPFISALNGTPAAGAFGYPVRLGGGHILELTATSEAQRVDLLSVDGFAIAANPIVEFAFRLINDGSNATQDFTIGMASGTHATDFQSVAEFVAVSTVGNSTNINVQSDDGTTDVAPTDSTLDYVEGSAVANRVEGWLDARNPSDVQVYINGALVLGASTFTLAAATGPLFLIAHLEKTTGTDVYKVGVDWLRVRYAEQ